MATQDDFSSAMNTLAGFSDIAMILGITESTVKKHVPEVFEKLGVETRGAAALRALEILNSPAAQHASPMAN
jgi:predicted transcriptional regulator